MCTDQTSVNWQDSWGGILQAGQTNSTESLGIQGLPALRCSLKPSLTRNVRQEESWTLIFVGEFIGAGHRTSGDPLTMESAGFKHAG